MSACERCHGMGQVFTPEGTANCPDCINARIREELRDARTVRAAHEAGRAEERAAVLAYISRFRFIALRWLHDAIKAGMHDAENKP